MGSIVRALAFTIVVFYVFLNGVVSANNEFNQAPCPNKCSYELNEAMTINCMEHQKTVKIPKKIKHLNLIGCDDHNLPTLVNISSIQSVTLQNRQNKKIYPVRIFQNFKHVFCLKLQGPYIAFGPSNISAFQSLVKLEYLEFDQVQFDTRDDYIFHLNAFQEENNLQSFVLSYSITKNYTGTVDVKVLLIPLKNTKLSCLTIHNQTTSIMFDLKNLLDSSLWELYGHLRTLRLRNMFELTSMNTDKPYQHGRFLSVFPKLKNLKTFETSKALEVFIGCPALENDITRKYINENNFPFIHKCSGGRYYFPASRLGVSLEEVIFDHTVFSSPYGCRNDIRTRCVFVPETKAKRVDMSYLTQRYTNIFNTIIYGLDELISLNMEGNNIDKLPDIFFNFFPKLQTLFLGGNKVGNILEKDYEGLIFHKLHQLRYLDLSSNNIKRLPTNIFKALIQLRKLILTDNSLIKFEVDLWPMERIELIDLTDNSLAKLSSNTTYVLDKTRQRNSYGTIILHLNNNPLTCTCGDFTFIKWLQNTKVYFINGDSYSCKNVQGQNTTLREIDLDALHRFCNPFTTGQISAIVVSTILLQTFIIFCIVAYKKRHQWRYKLFRIYYYRNKTNKILEFQYDGYVCYSSEDYQWVHSQLLSNLENIHGLKLCLDKRDFVVGGFITNNILESIEKSRKTILIISPEFVNSKWCEYEMYMAHQKFLDQGHDVIVPVLYQKLEENRGNNLLKTIIRMKTYIAWDTNNTEHFWKQLKEAICSV